ncbi:MAG: type II secretion system GspH family protein [Fimbriimonadaceae bacterium]|nr:type II secretion system protein [Chthonomonadaceae bacterium]MCO5296448.1 type II secretion system GspH family protein [Fimbriimonadaceae bacterium]
MRQSQRHEPNERLGGENMTIHSRRGFTLLEILTVAVIVALLAGLLAPVLVRAKRSAKDTVALSNLRQCGMAILIYADDHGGIANLPLDTNFPGVLDNMPTCDSQDTWRAGCDSPSIAPMIGSYAYIRNANDFKRPDIWNLTLTVETTPTLLLSVFSANNPPHPFDQDVEPRTITNFMPDRTVRFIADGSAGVTIIGSEGIKDPFSWTLLFSRWMINGSRARSKESGHWRN